jgi:hypothetical protein
MPGDTFLNADSIAQIGENIVKAHLAQHPLTTKVEDVRDPTEWQQRGVDLLWHRSDKTEPIWVEVKTDQWRHRYPNFWLETVSNEELNTLGCFLKTQSHYFAYCYIDTGDLYMIPTKPAQEWFKKNINSFQDARTHTGPKHAIQHHALGKRVPIKDLTEAVDTLSPFDVSTEVKQLLPDWQQQKPCPR